MPRPSLTGYLVAVGALAACTDGTAPPRLERPNLNKKAAYVKIDGVINRTNEWRDATSLKFMVNAPEGLVPAELLSMRDETNLYFAVIMQRPAGGLDGEAIIGFDNDNDGERELYDDQIFAGGVPPVRGLADGYLGPEGTTFDALEGGTRDGDAAVASTATTTTYEIRHPLKSGDLYDVALTKTAPRVGLELLVRIAIPGLAGPLIDSGEFTHTQVASWGVFCTLTAFPSVSVGACPSGEIASVRVTPNPQTNEVRLISMGTHQTFIEPLGLFAYDYLGNPMPTTSCTWFSTDESIVDVDDQGHITTGDNTGTAIVIASCPNRVALLQQGAVKITVQ